MNTGQGQAHESYFGPASELLTISDFLLSVTDSPTNVTSDADTPVADLTSSSHLEERVKEEWLELSDATRSTIAVECSIDDLRKQLNNVVETPRLMAHTMKTHELFVQSIYESADTSNRKKRKRATLPDPSTEHPEVVSLRQKLDSVQLQSWPLSMQSAFFIRPPKHSDHNTLTATKCFSLPLASNDPHQALIFITVYNPLNWGHRLLGRSSQHVLLSSQTLGDLFDIIPCTSNEIPDEVVSEDGIHQWKDATRADSTGAVICIEDIAYGDGQSEDDYSDKLIGYLKSLPSKNRPSVTKGTVMHETKLSTLTIRLNKPYWLLHSGDCEHFILFDQVRLYHPSDPPISKYPLTTQMTPPLLDTCRACSKAPAVYAVNGDMRLGESPFLICAPCWRWMGMPQGEDASRIVVAELPKHEFGWGGHEL